MTTPPTSFPEPGQDPNWGNQLISAITDRDAIIQAVAEGRVTPAELQAAISGVAGDLNAHAQTTRDVHGITDTAELATTGDVDGISTDLATHTDATQGVHGIADTGDLVTTDDARLSDARDPLRHEHPVEQISDATTLGRLLLTAASTDSARDALDITVDTSVGTRVFIGDVMVYGDTGWRDISGLLVAGLVVSSSLGSCLIRRDGNQVTAALKVDVTEGGITRLLEGVPVGFRGGTEYLYDNSVFTAGHTGAGASALEPTHVGVVYPGSIPIPLQTGSGTPYPNPGTVAWTITYPTTNAWPSSLPGSPA